MLEVQKHAFAPPPMPHSRLLRRTLSRVERVGAEEEGVTEEEEGAVTVVEW